MKHEDHVNLIKGGVHQGQSLRSVDCEAVTTWAELGSGHGAFTLALAEILASQGHIISVDKDLHSLRAQRQQMQARFPHASVEYLQADFTQPLPFRLLDGILMANSLHFIKDKTPFLRLVLDYLKPGGRFILVEYNVDQGNMWVPYPLSFETWKSLAQQVRLKETRLLHKRPSSFLREFFSALSIK